MQWPQIGPPLGIPFTINRASPQAKGLILWFPTIGQKTGKLVDYHTGVFTGGTWSGDTKIIPDGVLGQALDFDGTGDRIQFSHDARLSPTNKTVSAWVRFDSTSGTRTLVKKDGDYILRTDGGNFQFFVWSGGAQQASLGSVMATATYYLMTGTWDGTTIRFYLNGRERATTTPGGGTGTSTNALTFGAQSGGGEDLDGVLADIRIYDRCLSPGEVAALYNPQTRWELYQPLVRIPAAYFFTEAATIIDPGTASMPLPAFLRARPMPKASYQFVLHNPQREPMGLLTGYDGAQYTLTNDNQGSGFSMGLVNTDPKLVKDGSFVLPYRRVGGGYYRYQDTYLIASRPESVASGGTHFNDIEGDSFTKWITAENSRVMPQLDSTLGSFVSDTPADNALKYFLSRTLGKGAGNSGSTRGRDLYLAAGLTVAKDQSLGPSIDYNASLKPISTIIKDIVGLAELDKFNPCRLFIYARPRTFTPRLTFELVTMVGRLPSASKPRRQRGAFGSYRGFNSSSPILLGPSFGNVSEVESSRDRREGHTTVAITYNTKTAITRLTDERRAADFPTNFREIYQDASASGLEVDALVEGRAFLNEGKDRFITKLTLIDNLFTVFERDYFLGDIVGVVLPGRTFEAEVTGATIVVSPDNTSVVQIRTEEIFPFVA